MDGTEKIDIEALLAENTALKATIETLKSEHESLKLLVNKLKQQIFGKKSEKLTSEDTSIQEELFAFEVPESSTTTSVPVSAHSREIQRGRKPLPKNLDRERIEYEPDVRVCNCCGAELEKIGEEITEELD